MDLAALPTADAAALVRALVGDALPEELDSAVVDRSDGTPLFIEELLRTWVGVGTLVREEDAWRLTVRPEAVAAFAEAERLDVGYFEDRPAARASSEAAKRGQTWP